jgi:2'-5' RNA ligase
MTRTFIALEMNDAQQRHLSEVIQQVALSFPSIRWVNPESIHLTLAFLGELDDERLEKAIEAAQEAAQQAVPFSYRLTQLGAFGPPHAPRVIWMGIEEPTGKLERVYRALNRELRARRFEVERRPFSPHLTLARVKAPLDLVAQQDLQDLLQSKQQGLTTNEAYTITSLHVMKSELSRGGAQYTCPQECLFQP